MNTKITLIAAVCIFLVSENAITQELTKSSFSNLLTVSTGNSILARQDLIYSSFVHSGHSFHSYELKYQREKNFYQYCNINFSVNTSQLGDPFEMDMDDHSHGIYPHEFLFVSTAYGIGKPVNSSFRNRNWVGFALKIDLQAAFYNFALSDMFGYYIENSANGWFRTTYTANDKHHISARFELPFFSWLARSPYLAEDDEFIENISSHNRSKIILDFVKNGKLTTWNKLQRINLDLEYIYPVSKRLFIGVDYRFIFIHSSKPRTLLSYHHNVNVTSSLKF